MDDSSPYGTIIKQMSFHKKFLFVVLLKPKGYVFSEGV